MNVLKIFIVLLLSWNLVGCDVLQRQITNLAQTEVNSNTTKISGVAKLHNQTNHSGIVVKVGKQVQSSGIVVKTVNYLTAATTGQSGGFEFDVTMGASSSSITTQGLNLATGLYTVEFSKDGYETKAVENVPVVLGQSTYNLNDVELTQTISYIDVPVGINMELLVLTNNTDQYKLELVDSIVSNETKFDLIYFNLQGQYGMFFVENATWEQVANTIITNQQNCSIRLYIHNGGSPIKVNVVKL